MSAPLPQLDGREAWSVAFASFGMVMVMVGLGTTLILVVSLKQIAAEFAWPRAVPSAAYALTLVGEGVGGIAMGMLAERRGMGPVVLIGALALGVGLILVSLMDSEFQFYVAYGLLIGLLGMSTLFAPMLANTTRWFARRRGLAVALVASGQSIAGAVWPNVFEYSNQQIGWRGTFLWFGAFVLGTMLPLGLVVRRKPPGFRAPAPAPVHARTAVEGVARVLGLTPNFVLFLLFLAIVFCCVAMAAPLVHLVSHATDLGHAASRAAAILSVALVASVFSRFALGALSDRAGGLPTLLIGSLLQAIALFLFAHVTSMRDLYLVAIVFGLGFGGIVPSYAIIIRELFPAQGTGWRIPVVLMGGALGMALGGVMSGHIFDVTGSYFWAFYAGLAFNIANLAIVIALMRRRRRELGGRWVPARA